MADDYVKRSDVHKAFQPKYAPAINRTFAAMIDSVPVADVAEVKYGKWIFIPPDFDLCGVIYYECSECGKEQQTPSNYCQFCGAKMEGELKDVK